jgi:hypothetical protein
MRNEGLSSVMPFTNRKLVDKVIRDEAIVYDVWRLTVPVGEGRDERLEKAVNTMGDLKFQKSEIVIFQPGVMLQGYPLRNLEDSKNKTLEGPSVMMELDLLMRIEISEKAKKYILNRFFYRETRDQYMQGNVYLGFTKESRMILLFDGMMHPEFAEAVDDTVDIDWDELK